MNTVYIVGELCVAAIYFIIAVLVIPRVTLSGIGTRRERVFQGGAVLFFTGCGLAHIRYVQHVLASHAHPGIYDVWLVGIQLLGGIEFVVLAFRFIDISVQSRLGAFDDLQDAVYRDPLTGVYNRRHLSELLEQELDERSPDNPIAILQVDIDHFKSVNDELGHSGGDLVLKLTTAAIGASLRISDTLARTGGDEFVVVLPGIGRGMAESVAERVLANVAKHGGGSVTEVTASVGIAVFPTDVSDIQHLLEVADRAMYTAKQHGGNQFAHAKLLDESEDLVT